MTVHSSRFVSVLRAVQRELEAILLLLPALFGVFCAGALLGVMVGINPYVSATLVMGVWVLLLVLVVALRQRREYR